MSRPRERGLLGVAHGGVRRCAELTGVRVSVPIISTNEGEWLQHALASVLRQDDVDIVVYDNACEDDSAAIAAELGVHCIRLAERHSYSQLMNLALEEVDGDVVLMMQPDCFLAPGFISAARRHFEDPSVGSVAPKLIRTKGPDPGQRLDTLDTAGMVVDRRRKNGLVGHGARASAFGLPAEVFGADGAAALYRRQTLLHASLDGQVFDEELVAWRDGMPADWACDADLAWRTRLLGWRCVYEPGALAYHVRRYSPSKRAQIAAWQRMVQFRNRYLMIIKNDPLPALLRDLPFVLPYEIAALGFALLREPSLLRGYREAAALYPSMRRKRAELQRRRADSRPSHGIGGAPYGLTPPA